jgi:ATP-dependent DNA ligase
MEKSVKYIKCKLYKGESLTGCWSFSYKIDGVRALVRKDGVVSRNGKPLYNLDWIEHNGIDRDYEIFAGSWEETITKVRSKSHQIVPRDMVYELSPNLDPRLNIGEFLNPTKFTIQMYMNMSISLGYEGLVLRDEKGTWIKVKPTETYDEKITGIIEGKGKNVGMLGAFMTPKGKVGTGFTDKHRKDYFDSNLIGETVEVECMGLTKDGMFRHPRFVRIRWDK